MPAILASVIALSRTLPEVTAESAIAGLGNDPARSPPAEPLGVELSAVRAIEAVSAFGTTRFEEMSAVVIVPLAILADVTASS